MQLFFNHYILLLPNFQITYRSQNSNFEFTKTSCFQTEVTFSQAGDANISSGRNDWEYFIPIVTIAEASSAGIVATPNTGNQIYLYSQNLANQKRKINVLCIGK